MATPAVSLTTPLILYSPEWWLKRLLARSNQRRVDDASWSWEATTWEPYQDEGEDFPVRNQLGLSPSARAGPHIEISPRFSDVEDEIGPAPRFRIMGGQRDGA